jgi:hypothetical protein
MKALLLQLCQYPFEPSKRAELAELIKQVNDWEKTTRLINSHGIIALAAYNIKEAHLENLVPSEYMAFLENGLQRNILRNAWLKERWKNVNNILNSAGIKHILLKGMALEHTLYGGHGLRQMTDIDILIHPDKALKAWKILQENGFRTGLLKSSLHQKIIVHSSNHLPALIKDDYSVEIHTRLFSRNKAHEDYSDLIAETTEIMIDGVPANVLPENVHLEYLISHFEKHLAGGECQMRTFADIVLLDKSGAISFPDKFVQNPFRNEEFEYRKFTFRSAVRSVPIRYRFRFVIGDIFPSIKWMRERYGCGALGAVMRYPMRVGKLGWLV